MPPTAQSDGIEVELIRSLFDAFLPSVIMSVGFAAAGAVIAWESADPLLLILLVGGVLASAVRLLVAWQMKDATDIEMDIGEARRLERRFALPYIGFACLLGLFGARVLHLPLAAAHMVMMCLLVGYGAGVAAGIGLRPRIAVPSMLLAIAPGILVTFTHADSLYWAAGAMTAALLAGGIHSLRVRHRRAAREIGRRLTFATLARQDVLTALPNRLALREWFDDHVTARATPGLIAVHCLDLNGFKPVNDSYGHPVGDALLTAVGKRLARTIRDVDMAARLGGDEFAVVQRGIADADEAAQLAQRLAAAIRRPYRIETHDLCISTCIGYIVSDGRGDDLEHLLARADEALYAGKRSGHGITRYTLPLTTSGRAAAA